MSHIASDKKLEKKRKGDLSITRLYQKELILTRI